MIKFPQFSWQLGRRKFLQWMQNYENVLDWELTLCLLLDSDIWFLLGLGRLLVACKQERKEKQDSLWGWIQVWEQMSVNGESEAELEGEG